MCFTTVSLVTSNIRGSSICSPKSLHKKTSHEVLAELKAAFKTGASKVPRSRPVLPSLLRPICQACVNSQLSPTHAVGTKRKGEEERSETNFSSCNDRSSKWIINDYYIFFPNLRIWAFLFLRTPFFKNTKRWSYVTARFLLTGYRWNGNLMPLIKFKLIFSKLWLCHY